MFKTTLDFLNFAFANFSFLFSLIFLTILSVTFSKSIKQHAKIYYWIVGAICLSFTIPVILKAFKIMMPSIMSVPVIGGIAGELSNAATFLHPVLVIIMFMGAFSPKIPSVGKLMSIRKELSILVGFPFFAHISKRLFHTFPHSWDFFMNYEESIASPRVLSPIGNTIEHAVFVLGVVMTVLFLVLWITSFGSIHRKLGAKKWKSVQRWSYALYAMLYIHSVGMQVNSLMSYNAQQAMIKNGVKTELVGKDAHGATDKKGEKASSGGHHGPKRFSFADIKINEGTKATMNIAIYSIIYGSYLYLRIRKAKKDRQRKQGRK